MDRKKSRALSPARFGVPAEVLPRMPRITLSGEDQVFIENHGGLLTYSQSCIEIGSRNGFVRISGDELELAAMTRKDIVIRGLVASVEYC